MSTPPDRPSPASDERVERLPEWIIRKLKTLGEYYEPPTDGRDVVSEIQGWMHVLCFHYIQNRRDVKEYDAARKQAKELAAALAAERAEKDELRCLLAKALRCWHEEAHWGDGIAEQHVETYKACAAKLLPAP